MDKRRGDKEEPISKNSPTFQTHNIVAKVWCQVAVALLVDRGGVNPNNQAVANGGVAFLINKSMFITY